MPEGETIEQCLSLGGMLRKWNKKKKGSPKNILSLFEYAASGDSIANDILEKAVNAFTLLINDRTDFFYSQNAKPEKIVIGQRLGNLLSDKNNPLSKLILKNYNNQIPIEISTDRRTAAIGAAYKANENIK
jgi:predicted NBD/HSP70 family sugar kinase